MFPYYLETLLYVVLQSSLTSNDDLQTNSSVNTKDEAETAETAEVPADLPAEVVESEPPEDAEVLEASGGLGGK